MLYESKVPVANIWTAPQSPREIDRHVLQTLAEPLNPDQFQLHNQVQQELNYLQTFDTDLSNI
ncbi:hypothetical protein MH205_19115, partial [Bacillus altitudinis]